MISTDTSANVIQDPLAPQAIRATLHDPRTAALVWLSAYLAASGLTIALGSHEWLAGIHIAVIAVAMWSAGGRSGARRAIGDLLPLAATPLLYTEIPLLIAELGTRYHDVAVQGWESWIFGTQPSRTLAGGAPFAVLSELLHAGYLAYYAVIFAPPLLLLVRGQRRGFAETVLAVTVTGTVCWALFALFPVQGPRYLWPAPNGIPEGPFRSLALRVLASGSSRGAAFPSSHVAVSVVQAMMAWRWQRRVGLVLWPTTFLIGVGAVYGGFHYAVDVIAGALLGVLVAAAIGIFASTGAGTSRGV